eukprot:4207321-Pyramimonas_sp.AAC.1
MAERDRGADQWGIGGAGGVGGCGVAAVECVLEEHHASNTVGSAAQRVAGDDIHWFVDRGDYGRLLFIKSGVNAEVDCRAGASP